MARERPGDSEGWRHERCALIARFRLTPFPRPLFPFPLFPDPGCRRCSSSFRWRRSCPDWRMFRAGESCEIIENMATVLKVSVLADGTVLLRSEERRVGTGCR